MSYDISRLLKQPLKHYAAARLQQGRVLLDSDFNEAAWLEENDARQTWLDVVGPEGSPDQGFTLGQPFPVSPPEVLEQVAILRPDEEIEPEDVRMPEDSETEQLVYNVTLRPGRMFLGGRRFDLERPEPIAFQRDFLQSRVNGELGGLAVAPEPPEEFRALYYLHAWEQIVTAVEDQELAEAMLRGSDTSVRVRRVRRVESFATDEDNCTEAFDDLIDELEDAGTSVFDRKTFELKSQGRLRLVFKENAESADPCGPCAPLTQYVGAENATLRIMLVSAFRFVWAFDNGAQIFRIRLTGLLEESATTFEAEIEMLTPPTREEDLPVEGRTIEILPFGALLEGGNLPPEQAAADPHFRKIAAEVGVFMKATTSFDRTTNKFKVALDVTRAQQIRDLVSAWHPRHPDAEILNVGADDPTTRHFYMRLWQQMPPEDVDFALVADDNVDGTPLGDTGVVPVFTHATNDDAEAPVGNAGDFWIATLRTDDPGRVVPYDLMQEGGVAPHGPHHFYTPVALLHIESEGEGGPMVVQENGDCRSRLRRIGDQGCFTCTVGDGVTSTGDFLSIQQAIESLPSSGGRIGIRPGLYDDEQIVIDGRRDVILEGCGPSTIIATPESLPSGPLLEIRDSADITITGLTLQAITHTALSARRVTDLTLSDIHVTADTVLKEDSTIPVGALSTAPLVELAQVGSAEVRALTLAPGSRPGLVVAQSELVTLRDLQARGEPTSFFPPSAPLVAISDSELVRMEDARLEPFGQIGVAVRGSSRDVELRSLTVRASTNEADFANETGFQVAQALLVGEGLDEESPPSPDPRSDTEDLELDEEPDNDAERVVTSETQAGVDIDNGEGVRLVRSDIRLDGSSVSEHCAVVARGRDIVIEDNTIELLLECHDSPAEPVLLQCDDLRGAFGAIQIRGGSDGVEIRRNRIQGGLGHGITLGSVLWHVAGASPQFARRIGGAGTGQLVPLSEQESTRIVLGRNLGNGFEDDDGNEFLPRSEGRIRDLVIADNRVKEMFASGISVLTVLGLLNRGGEFIEVEGARIEGNTIEGNLVRPGRDLPDIGDVMPFPASLSGPSVISVLPFGGIVLGTVTAGLDILNNTVRDNGNGAPETLDVTRELPINGIFVLNGEGLNISGNRVMNNGARAPTGTTLLRPGVRAGIAVMLAGTGPTNDVGDLRYFVGGRGTLSSDNSSLRVVDNTVIQPEGRALHVVATGPMTIDGNFLSSQGHHGSLRSVDRLAIGDAVFVQNLGAPWEASEIESVVAFDVTGANPPRIPDFTSAPRALTHLLNTEDASPRMYIGDGGSILFNNNQVIYDWDVQRVAPGSLLQLTPLSFFPVAVLGLDHIAVNANQFGLRVNLGALPLPPPPIKVSSLNNPPDLPPGLLLLANVLVLGGTVEVTRNRSAERVGSTLLSLLTSAEIMNITALNQTTHVNLALSALDSESAGAERRSENNQVIFFRKYQEFRRNPTTGDLELTDVFTPDPPGSPKPPANARFAIRNSLRRTFVRLLRRRTR